VIGRDLVEPARLVGLRVSVGVGAATNQNTEGTCHSAPNDPKSSLALQPLPRAVRRPDLRHPDFATFQDTETGSGSNKAEHDPLIVPGGGGCSMWV
jgi:hypothetical protein